MTSPTLVEWVARVAPTADVVHVHLARDFASLPAAAIALARRAPLVIQTHGMIQPTGNPAAPLLDAVLTRRVLRSAGRVFYLTDAERAGLERVTGGLRLQHLRNGITFPAGPTRAKANDSSASAAIEVLYLARLQARKHPRAFVEIAAALAPSHPDARFTLVGPDEGQGAAVEARIAELGLGPRVRWIGPVPPERARDIMAGADLYVLPSVDEPYPMTVIEALAFGLPVVLTDSNGLAPLVVESGAGTVVSGAPLDLDGLTQAVDRYLSDADLRIATAIRARRVAEERLSMPAVVAALVRTYDEVIGAAPPPYS